LIHSAAECFEPVIVLAAAAAAFNYMNCVTALRKAGIAKRGGDAEAHAQQLQAAVEALHDALNAQAAVARGNSDRGVIAVLNHYGYRPLKQELETLEVE